MFLVKRIGGSPNPWEVIRHLKSNSRPGIVSKNQPICSRFEVAEMRVETKMPLAAWHAVATPQAARKRVTLLPVRGDRGGELGDFAFGFEDELLLAGLLADLDGDAVLADEVAAEQLLGQRILEQRLDGPA